MKFLNERAGKPNCFDEAVLKAFETIDSNRESCPLCSSTFQNRYMLLRHLADCHFRERLCQGMVTSPDSSTYKCPAPDCNHESKDKGGYVRHYGLVHKMVQKWLKVRIVKLLTQAFSLAIGKKNTQVEKTQNSRKKLKLKLKTENFGII